MLRSLKSFHGNFVDAVDGEIGSVARFLIDTDRWVVRYLVVDTGDWWQGHEVLISPLAVGQIDGDRARIALSRTRDEVRNSPPYDASQPLTRDHEATLLAHYRYPVYWAGPHLWGPTPFATAFVPPPSGPGPEDRQASSRTAVIDRELSGLADSQTVIGTHIHAADGDIGHVDDGLAEDQSWILRYLVADTSNWWIGKHVLISPQWVERLDWRERKLHVVLERQAIRSAPEYDPSTPLARADETALYQHYGRSPYWRA